MPKNCFRFVPNYSVKIRICPITPDDVRVTYYRFYRCVLRQLPAFVRKRVSAMIWEQRYSQNNNFIIPINQPTNIRHFSTTVNSCSYTDVTVIAASIDSLLLWLDMESNVFYLRVLIPETITLSRERSEFVWEPSPSHFFLWLKKLSCSMILLFVRGRPITARISFSLIAIEKCWAACLRSGVSSSSIFYSFSSF